MDIIEISSDLKISKVYEKDSKYYPRQSYSVTTIYGVYTRNRSSLCPFFLTLHVDNLSIQDYTNRI